MDATHPFHAGTSARRTNWRRILAVLRSEDLLIRLQIGTDTRIGVEPISWDRYWTETGCRISPDQEAHLDALRSARLRYIEGQFDLDHAAAYCHAYFAFLRQVLDDVADGNADSVLLHATLGLECTSVTWARQPTTLAALTSTARNPAYLLAKLRTPQAYDDPKFLPLITAFDPSDPSCHLYYHYRQFSAGKRVGFRLLLYPPAAVDARPEAFRCIHSLAAGLSRKQDTRASKRSTRICDLAVGPFLERLAQSSAWNSEKEIRIVDLGAGSGDLTRGIVESLATRFPTVTEGRRLALTMVDVGFQNQRRHVRHWPFFRKLSAFRCRRSDYISWINSQEPTNQETSDQKLYDVVLLCRLLNNASQFAVDWVDDYYQVRKLSGGGLSYQLWKEGVYLPHIALDPVALCAANLISSNASFRSRRGTVFRQLSLTDYFRGLHYLTEEPLPHDIRPQAVFFPARQFDESAPLMPDGSSIFGKLCRLAEAVIIEDVDLDARMLRRHFERYGLTHLAATDATDRSRMRSASLLCVAEKACAAMLPGRRIW